MKLERCRIKPSTLSVSPPPSMEYKNVVRFVGKRRFFFHLQKLIFLPLLSNRLIHLYQIYKILSNRYGWITCIRTIVFKRTHMRLATEDSWKIYRTFVIFRAKLPFSKVITFTTILVLTTFFLDDSPTETPKNTPTFQTISIRLACRIHDVKYVTTVPKQIFQSES